MEKKSQSVNGRSTVLISLWMTLILKLRQKLQAFNKNKCS